MKSILIFVTIFGLALAAPTTKSLKEDLQDFLNLIPLDQIKGITSWYLKNDAEFQEVVSYLQGPEWAELEAQIGKHPAWIEFEAYMQEAGIDIEAIIQLIRDLFKTPASERTRTHGIKGYLNEIISIIPAQDMLVLLSDKLQNSPDFQEFYQKISSEEAHQLFEEMRSMEEVQRIAERLRQMGIDVDKIVQLIYIIFGWV